VRQPDGVRVGDLKREWWDWGVFIGEEGCGSGVGGADGQRAREGWRHWPGPV
jgi:hypothetical protein